MQQLKTTGQDIDAKVQAFLRQNGVDQTAMLLCRYLIALTYQMGGNGAGFMDDVGMVEITCLPIPESAKS